MSPLGQRKRQEQTTQNRQELRENHTSTEAQTFVFIGGGMADHESPVLVIVYTETGMVFANVCKRKGADPDILKTLMEDIEVLGQRQIVFKSDQENLAKAVQRELAARRPEMKLENSPKYHSAAKRHGGKCSAASDWVDESADGRT